MSRQSSSKVAQEGSHFSLDLGGAVTLKALLKRVGVSVLAVSEPLDPDSPAAVIVEDVLEAVNEWYSVNLGREVEKGLRQRAEQGLWNGDLPFGYMTVQSVLKTIEDGWVHWDRKTMTWWSRVLEQANNGSKPSA